MPPEKLTRGNEIKNEIARWEQLIQTNQQKAKANGDQLIQIVPATMIVEINGIIEKNLGEEIKRLKSEFEKL